MVKIYTFLIKLMFIFGLFWFNFGLIWFILAQIAAKNIGLMLKKSLYFSILQHIHSGSCQGYMGGYMGVYGRV